ncbi:hypothetical protein EUX98_g6111 [Antrodiella citrinella]|uniref:Alpha-type protein kinase domain-containing protein n=1 Tax=Antrodiella citrinella TaxID=2447956 RepID=A0A4S4MSE9_9APHY|nr:hypothetical protein EUX98_g6111 [Antrodiella citrinella]
MRIALDPRASSPVQAHAPHQHVPLPANVLWHAKHRSSVAYKLVVHVSHREDNTEPPAQQRLVAIGRRQIALPTVFKDCRRILLNVQDVVRRFGNWTLHTADDACDVLEIPPRVGLRLLHQYHNVICVESHTHSLLDPVRPRPALANAAAIADRAHIYEGNASQFRLGPASSSVDKSKADGLKRNIKALRDVHSGVSYFFDVYLAQENKGKVTRLCASARRRPFNGQFSVEAMLNLILDDGREILRKLNANQQARLPVTADGLQRNNVSFNVVGTQNKRYLIDDSAVMIPVQQWFNSLVSDGIFPKGKKDARTANIEVVIPTDVSVPAMEDYDYDDMSYQSPVRASAKSVKRTKRPLSPGMLLRVSMEYDIFIVSFRPYVYDQNHEELLNELKLLALGDYFMKTYYDRANVYNCRGMLPDMSFNHAGAFIGTTVNEDQVSQDLNAKALMYTSFLATPLIDTQDDFGPLIKFSGSVGPGSNTHSAVGIAVDAFAHHVLVDSEGACIFVDLQGFVHRHKDCVVLIDPQTHTDPR